MSAAPQTASKTTKAREAVAAPKKRKRLTIRELLLPHAGSLALGFVAVLGEAIANLLQPWPLKIVWSLSLRARSLKAKLTPLVDVIVAAGTCLVLWFGARLTLSGALSVGSMVLFVQYLSKMYKPMQELSKMTDTYSKAAVGYERIQEILQTDDEVHDLRGATPPTLLMHLPLLPKELQYRIVGSTLVLYDMSSDLIVDFMPNAVPAA